MFLSGLFLITPIYNPHSQFRRYHRGEKIKCHFNILKFFFFSVSGYFPLQNETWTFFFSFFPPIPSIYLHTCTNYSPLIPFFSLPLLTNPCLTTLDFLLLSFLNLPSQVLFLYMVLFFFHRPAQGSVLPNNVMLALVWPNLLEATQV